MKQQYDVVVIGAGSGGLTAAVGFSKVGKKVLLVEAEHMGGECTNSGCIPSKALLHHAKTFYNGQRFEEGAKSEAFRTQAFNYVHSVVDDILEEETPAVFEKLGIEVVMGKAEFTSPCSIKVHDTEYSYKRAVIATGSEPRQIDIPGVSTEKVLTNQNLFELNEIPPKLLIIGGGPIGLEMAQAFAMLGSEVSIVERGEELARLEDPKIRAIIHENFKSLGINIYTNAEIEKVENDTATIHSTDTGESTKVAFDKVLVAIGRVPQFPDGLDAAGIKYDERCIKVDSQHRTSNKYVYAVGDVAQRLKFTHTADDIARQVVTRVVSKGWLRLNTRKAVPKVTYTQPEIAQVGMLEEEALAKYGPDRIMRIDVPFDVSDRAKTEGATTGHLTVTVRRINGAILGANIIGPAAGEIISIFTLAIDQKISLWKLRNLIYAYPTYSLVVKKAGDYFFAQQVASLKTDIFNSLKRALPKIVAACVWIGGLLFLHQYQADNNLTATEVALGIFTFISSTAWGPLLYIAAYSIRPIVFFPATVLTILAGIFFGLVYGTIFTIIAATLSAAVAYLVGRFFGSNLQLEDSVVGNWVEALRKNTFEATLTARLLFLPYDVVSYAAGIIKANFIPFLSATALGIILGTATFVSIGASLQLEEFTQNGFSTEVIDSRFLLLSAGIFIVSLTLSRILKRWKAEA